MTTLRHPRQHQREAMDFHTQSNMMGTLLWHGMGLGKAQPLSSKIYTPHGPKTMGEIQVGDHVIGMYGKPKRVNSIHPQGVKKVYRVTFNDGSSAECCAEHLWSVRTAQQKFRGAPYKVIALKDLMDDLIDSSGNNK